MPLPCEQNFTVSFPFPVIDSNLTLELWNTKRLLDPSKLSWTALQRRYASHKESQESKILFSLLPTSGLSHFCPNHNPEERQVSPESYSSYAAPGRDGSPSEQSVINSGFYVHLGGITDTQGNIGLSHL